MADVGLEAARQRLAHHRMDLAVLVDEAAGMTGERMRENVPGPQNF